MKSDSRSLVEIGDAENRRHRIGSTGSSPRDAEERPGTVLDVCIRSPSRLQGFALKAGGCKSHETIDGMVKCKCKCECECECECESAFQEKDARIMPAPDRDCREKYTT